MGRGAGECRGERRPTSLFPEVVRATWRIHIAVFNVLMMMTWREERLKGSGRLQGRGVLSVTKGNVVAVAGADGASLRLLGHHILSIKCIMAVTDGTVDCYCIGRVLLRRFRAMCAGGVFIYVNGHHREVSDPLRMKWFVVARLRLQRGEVEIGLVVRHEGEKEAGW